MRNIHAHKRVRKRKKWEIVHWRLRNSLNCDRLKAQWLQNEDVTESSEGSIHTRCYGDLHETNLPSLILFTAYFLHITYWTRRILLNTAPHLLKTYISFVGGLNLFVCMCALKI